MAEKKFFGGSAWTENFGAATGAPSAGDTLVKAGKGDFKGAFKTAANGAVDVTTLGISRGVRQKKEDEQEAAKRMEENSGRLGEEVDASLKRQGVMQDEYKKRRDVGLSAMDSSDTDYESRLNRLTSESETSARDASGVYKSMSGEYRGMQDKANEAANGAMTLREYEDPNNRVAAATRGLYDDRAEQERTRGQQDFGVLSALGNQATQTGMTGPMTVGQQVAMQAQNQRQAGEAYAGAQRKMQNLRDQGLQMGFDRSDAAYAAGESARDRQRGLMNDRQGLEGNYRNFELANRGEREGFSQNRNASERGRANRSITRATDNRGIGFQQEAGRMAEQMRRNGASESAIQTKLQQAAAEQAQYAKTAGVGVSTVGGVAGAYFGGPAGAKAGVDAGKGIGDPAEPQGGPAINPQGGTPTTSNFQPTSQQDSGGAFGQYLQRKYPARAANA